VGRALAAAELAAGDHGVGGQEVDGVAAGEALGQVLDQPLEALAVGGRVVDGLPAHEVVGAHDPPLGDEGQQGEVDGLTRVGGEPEDPAGVGPGGLGQQRHLAQLQQRGDRGQAAGVVVVAGDDHDLRPGPGQAEQVAVDDGLGLG
jgi:hypothetical protein